MDLQNRLGKVILTVEGSPLGGILEQSGYLAIYPMKDLQRGIEELQLLAPRVVVVDHLIMEDGGAEETIMQNSTTPIKLFSELRKWGTKVIYLSSSSVYGDGTGFRENDALHPETPFAISKVLAEEYIMHYIKDYIILRISPLYGPFEHFNKSYIEYVITQAKAGKDILAVRDHSVCPLYVRDLIKLLSILSNELSSRKDVFNFGGPDLVSQADIALLIVSMIEVDARVVPITRTDMYGAGSWKTSRLEVSSMNCMKIFQKLSLDKRTTIQQGLAGLLNEY
jgi:nucleoside-diphosphate-sugar epimerase